MDAAEQQRLALRLERALADAGIVVEYPVRSGGNLVGWNPVGGAEIIGQLMRRQWIVREVGAAAEVEAAPRGKLVPVRELVFRRAEQVVPAPADRTAHAPEDQADGHHGVTDMDGAPVT